MRAETPRTPAAIEGPAELVVFSDDWARHASSCQHLVRALLPEFQVLWLNTIGTRPPRLDRLTVHRALGKIKAWTTRREAPGKHPNPHVLEPVMWPSFKSRFGRRLNRELLARAIARSGPRLLPRIAVTTIPLVADLIGRIDVDRWVYYCVDDLEKWPGLDSFSLRRMERRLIAMADSIVAVSEVLVERMASYGREAALLTHGVDLDHWRSPSGDHGQAAAAAGLEPPLFVFWGVVDRRLSLDWVRCLNARLREGTIVLAGPLNEPDPELTGLDRVALTGPLPYRQLPALAQAAAVLVMPYADMPATRAIQPLKLKEYLATGKPVVVSPLPSVAAWRSACDVAASPDDFVDRVLERAESGLPEAQRTARAGLENESWALKAARFEQHLRGRAWGDAREGTQA